MFLRARNLVGDTVLVRVLAIDKGNKRAAVLDAAEKKFLIPTAWLVW